MTMVHPISTDPVPTFITDSNNKLERLRHEVTDLTHLVHDLANAAMGSVPEKHPDNPNLHIAHTTNTMNCIGLLEEAVSDLRREVRRFLLEG